MNIKDINSDIKSDIKINIKSAESDNSQPNNERLAADTSDNLNSSADNVDRHLQKLEDNSMAAEQRKRSPEEQLFTEEELARLINPDKLNLLMNSSEDLVRYLTGEIDKYEK